MAPRSQPVSLLSLAHSQVAQNLANICRVLHTLAQETCVAHVLNLTKNSLRPIWQSSIPACIRARLLDETTSLLTMQSLDGSSGSVTGAAPLYLLVLLLAKDIKKIRIELCCYYGCSHQTALLKFLGHEGTGLQSLELARSTLLRLDRCLLQSVFVSATSLRYLTFKNIANDGILQIIGSHCPNLVSLDVSHSKEVTDVGLKQLFLRVEIRDKTDKSNKKLNVGKDALYGHVKRNIRHVTKFLRKVCLPRRDRNSTAKELLSILEFCELRNNLCSTLKYLNIANTGVTTAGILMAILHVPDLESLGECCHIGRALELLEQSMPDLQANYDFKLKSVSSSRTTQRRLELVSERFPHLRKLKITEPMFPPKSLFTIPSSIVSLSLQSIPANDQWLRIIFDYLSGAHGAILEDLSLRFFPGDFLPAVDLGKFLPNCRNLRILNVDGGHVTWDVAGTDDGHDHGSSRVYNDRDVNVDNVADVTNFKQLKRLTKIQLGKVITTSAARNIFRMCPELRIFHAYSCSHAVLEDIFGVFGQNDPSYLRSSPLECFYVYETSCLTRDTLQTIVDTLPRIGKVGNFRNCGLTNDDAQFFDTWISKNNLDVKLHAGSHWFSSSCFPL